MGSFGMPIGEMPDDDDILTKSFDAESVFSNFSNSRPKQLSASSRKSTGSTRPVVVEVRKSRKIAKPT